MTRELRSNRRVCLLTGAGGTLGRAFCQRHADDYHIVAVHGRRRPELPNHRTGASGDGPSIFPVAANLADDLEIARVVDLSLARFDRIDLVVHAAVHSMWAPIFEPHLVESAERQFRINVLVALKLVVAVTRRFWEGRETENARLNRDVINVSSSAGVKMYPGLGQSVYAASKAALNHLTRHLASELRPLGVRANAVAPTSFPGIIPTQRVVEEIARLDRGAETGQIVLIEGGRDGL
jgi:NAD(P)-dependent dehydrogenase (short-subunit alcohol dehydrogenase family)